MMILCLTKLCIGLKDYNTVSGVNGPLVILDNVKASRRYIIVIRNHSTICSLATLNIMCIALLLNVNVSSMHCGQLY
jgi:hypothetical protein